MSVRFLDPGATYRELRTELDLAISQVLASGHYLLGEQLEALEDEFATAVGADCAVGVGSGLDALTIALRALGVGAGDDVLVPAHTFIATWLAVSALGATPVPVEPDETSGNIDVAAARAAIGPRTRAIVPVHLHGTPADIDACQALAADAGLVLVFDAAQAHGATYRDLPVGAYGDASAWSFYPAKNLGAFADGGAITFRDPAAAQRARRLRNYGSERKDEHLEQGVNSRLDELQAAVLRVKLSHLPEWNERRQQVAARYAAELADLPLVRPGVPNDRTSAWHLYAVRSGQRDALRHHLARHEIETIIHYPVPPHRQPAYAECADHHLPVADQWAATTLSLPIGPHLGAAEVDEVIAAVRSFHR